MSNTQKDNKINEIKKLTEEISKLKQSKEQSTKDWKKKLADCQSKLDTANESIIELKKALVIAKEGVQTEIQKEENVICQNSEELEKLKKENEELIVANKTLEAKYEELKQQLEKSNKKDDDAIKTIDKEKEDLRQKCEKLDKTLNEEKTKICNLENENENLKIKNEGNLKEIEHIMKNLKDSENEIINLKKKTEQNNKDLKEKDNLILKLKEENEKQESNNLENKKLYDLLLKRFELKEKAEKDLQSEVKTLKLKLIDAEKKQVVTEDLNQKIFALSLADTEKTKIIEQLKNELEAANNNNTQKKEDKTSFESEYNNLRKDYENLQKIKTKIETLYEQEKTKNIKTTTDVNTISCELSILASKYVTDPKHYNIYISGDFSNWSKILMEKGDKPYLYFYNTNNLIRGIRYEFKFYFEHIYNKENNFWVCNKDYAYDCYENNNIITQ